MCFIKKCGDTSQLEMGQVQNGRLYEKYRNYSMKTKAEECKTLAYTEAKNLHYSSFKTTCKV